MKKKGEGKGIFMKNRIRIIILISFLASQAFSKKVIEKIFTKKIHSIGILQKTNYNNKI
jgi:hypothetical protein